MKKKPKKQTGYVIKFVIYTHQLKSCKPITDKEEAIQLAYELGALTHSLTMMEKPEAFVKKVKF